MIEDLNKSIDTIAYNHLNLPALVLKENGHYIKYVYAASGTKVQQQVYDSLDVLKKTSDYSGEFFYENDTLKFINHEEGRVMMTGSSEYQYHLKDHLGNVRLTFTSKNETEEVTATMETGSAVSESSQFLNYEDVHKMDLALFDHTATGVTKNSMRLMGGNSTETYGLAKSLSVMPGDKINVDVYAKYLDPQTSNWNQALLDILQNLTGTLNPVGTYVDGGVVGNIDGAFPHPGVLIRESDTGTGPNAYLNYIVFDREYNYLDGGFRRISTNAREAGQSGTSEGVPHERLFVDNIDITQPGYVYIYLSNENETPVEVFFDDFSVEHIKSPVVQMDDYYPFGLSFNSYQRENSTQQNFLYNAKEKQDELGVGWYDYIARQYDPELGRFNSIDPAADLMRRFSPYVYAFDNPVRFTDPDGMVPEDQTLVEWTAEKDAEWAAIDDGADAFKVWEGKDPKKKKGSSNTDTDTESDQGDTQQGTGDAILSDYYDVSEAPQRGPYEGFWGTLDYFWNGGHENGYKYDKDGTPISKSPTMGFPPGFIGGPASGVKLTSALLKNPKLIKEALKAWKANSKDFMSLLREASKGNFNPGIGTKSLGKGISYFRHRDGGRIFFRNMSDGGIEVVGYANKANESSVIAELLKMLGQ